MRIDEPLKNRMRQERPDHGRTPETGRYAAGFSQKIKRGTISLDDLDNIATVSGCKIECSFVLANGEKVSVI